MEKYSGLDLTCWLSEEVGTAEPHAKSMEASVVGILNNCKPGNESDNSPK